MNVYILTRQGVYRHEILGIYENKDDAMSAGLVALEAESDAYHNIELNFARTGTPIEDAINLATWSYVRNPSRQYWNYDKNGLEIDFTEHKPVEA